MSVVKVVTLIGESPKNWEDAMRNVIADAQKSVRGITRIGATEFDVRMQENEPPVFRVRAEVSFRVER